MQPVSPSQIRGARGMLDWSLIDLARAARLSISAVARAEARESNSVAASAIEAIRSALAEAGIEFTSDDGSLGVRLRSRRSPVFPRFIEPR